MPTTTRRFAVSRLICAGPSTTSIFARLSSGTIAPRGEVIVMRRRWRALCPRRSGGGRPARLPVDRDGQILLAGDPIAPKIAYAPHPRGDARDLVRLRLQRR